MESLKNTNNTACGDSDITGVKNKSVDAAPERSEAECRHAADDGKNDGDLSVKERVAKKESEEMTKATDDGLAQGDGVGAVSSAEQTENEDSARALSDTEKEDREFLSLIKGKYRDAYRRRTEAIIRKRLKSGKGRASELSEGNGKTLANAAFEGGSDVSDGIGKLSANVAFEGSSGVSNGIGKLSANAAFEGGSGVSDGIGKLSANVAFEGSSGVSDGIGKITQNDISEGIDKQPTVKHAAVTVADGTEKNSIRTTGICTDENGAGCDSSERRRLFAAQKSQNQSRPRENGVGGSVGMYTGIKVSALKGSDVLAILRRAEAGEKIKFN